MQEHDPIFQYDDDATPYADASGNWMRMGKWYFWNEVWSDAEGPFDTEEEARNALDEYAARLFLGADGIFRERHGA